MEVHVIKAVPKAERVINSAAYVRVSSNLKSQDSSYANQLKYYADKFSDDPRYKLVEVYADRESGTKADNRNEFQRMLDDCRKGKIDRIYAKAVSRFARNAKESLTILRELKLLGISVYFEKEKLDTGVMSGEMMLTIYSIFAEEESKSIGKNVQWLSFHLWIQRIPLSSRGIHFYVIVKTKHKGIHFRLKNEYPCF